MSCYNSNEATNLVFLNEMEVLFINLERMLKISTLFFRPWCRFFYRENKHSDINIVLPKQSGPNVFVYCWGNLPFEDLGLLQYHIRASVVL